MVTLPSTEHVLRMACSGTSIWYKNEKTWKCRLNLQECFPTETSKKTSLEDVAGYSRAQNFSQSSWPGLWLGLNVCAEKQDFLSCFGDKNVCINCCIAFLMSWSPFWDPPEKGIAHQEVPSSTNVRKLRSKSARCRWWQCSCPPAPQILGSISWEDWSHGSWIVFNMGLSKIRVPPNHPF